MASTNLDGSNMMIFSEGNLITLVIGDKSYMGTLKMRTEGFQENWFIVLDEGGEIEIHKREKVEPKEPEHVDPA
jgi:hypothetical protein